MISGDDIPNQQDVDRETHRLVRYLFRLPYTSNGFPNGSRLTEIALNKLHSQGLATVKTYVATGSALVVCGH